MTLFATTVQARALALEIACWSNRAERIQGARIKATGRHDQALISRDRSGRPSGEQAKCAVLVQAITL